MIVQFSHSALPFSSGVYGAEFSIRIPLEANAYLRYNIRGRYRCEFAIFVQICSPSFDQILWISRRYHFYTAERTRACNLMFLSQTSQKISRRVWNIDSLGSGSHMSEYMNLPGLYLTLSLVFLNENLCDFQSWHISQKKSFTSPSFIPHRYLPSHAASQPSLWFTWPRRSCHRFKLIESWLPKSRVSYLHRKNIR